MKIKMSGSGNHKIKLKKKKKLLLKKDMRKNWKKQQKNTMSLN